jgi:hypothetical protein
MLIYFAAPLFCQAERAFNLQLTLELEKQGFTVFLPQRDGIESNKPPYNEMTSDQICQAIFLADRDKIHESDIFLFILDGRVPDEGACVALGIAYSQKVLLKQDKLLVGLHTDMRGAFPVLGFKLNPMIYSAFDHIAENENELIKIIEAYKNERI